AQDEALHKIILLETKLQDLKDEKPQLKEVHEKSQWDIDTQVGAGYGYGYGQNLKDAKVSNPKDEVSLNDHMGSTRPLHAISDSSVYSSWTGTVGFVYFACGELLGDKKYLQPQDEQLTPLFDYPGTFNNRLLARFLLEHGNALEEIVGNALEEIVFSWRSKVKYHEKSLKMMKKLQADKAAIKAMLVNRSRGCLGCPKVPFITNDKKPTGALKKDSATNKASVVQDFWSSSTHEMDHSAGQSQISASSFSMSNPNLDAHSSSGSNPPDFVNRGLLLWNQTRQQWIGDKGSSHRKKGREPAISWNATYDNLLGSNKPFPQSIPLREMVNFLVDVWEEEGLYD
ncbi:hypothetical protein Tco_0753224, partial [Tanacetum coccineum]